MRITVTPTTDLGRPLFLYILNDGGVVFGHCENPEMAVRSKSRICIPHAIVTLEDGPVTP
jgi:hypothetical protein